MAKKETKELTPRQKFWIRFVLWAVLAAILPFLFIAFRFEIFKSESKISLGGWGVLAIIIVGAFFISLIKYAYKGMRHGMLRQCITGFCSITVPLVMLYLVILSVESDIESFKQVLIVVVSCETVAIPINPMPKWLADNIAEKDKERIASMSDVIWDRYFHRQDKEKGE